MLSTMYTSLDPLITSLCFLPFLSQPHTYNISFQNHGMKTIITQHKPCCDHWQTFKYVNPLVLWFLIGLSFVSFVYLCYLLSSCCTTPYPTLWCVCHMDFCCTMCLTNTFILCSVLFCISIPLKVPHHHCGCSAQPTPSDIIHFLCLGLKWGIHNNDCDLVTIITAYIVNTDGTNSCCIYSSTSNKVFYNL